MSTTTTTTTTHTYELHTFIFPPQKPPRSSTSSIPRYFFPISRTLAHEFLHPPTPPSKPTQPGPECWPFHLLNHPEWVVGTILRFTDKMWESSSWTVAGMKFVDEGEEERERERELEERRRTRDREAVGAGRAVFYGGVYYGYWPEETKGKGGYGGYLGVTGKGQRRKGELKCQILLVKEEI